MDRRPQQATTVTRQIAIAAADTAETILSRTWQDDVDAPPPKLVRSPGVSRPTEATIFRWVTRQQQDAKRFCGLVVGDTRTVGLLEVCEDLGTPYPGDIGGDVEFLCGYQLYGGGPVEPGDPTSRRWADAIGVVTGAAVEGAQLAREGWEQQYANRFVTSGGVDVLDEMADMRLSQTLEALRKVVSGFRRIRGVSCPLPPSCEAGCGRAFKGTCGACRVRRHRESRRTQSA